MTEVVTELLSLAQPEDHLSGLFDAFADDRDGVGALVDLRPLAMAVLGGAMHRLGVEIAADPAVATEQVAKLVDGAGDPEEASARLAEVVAEGVREGLHIVTGELDRSIELVERLAKQVRAVG